MHQCFNIHRCLLVFLNNASVQTSNSLWKSAFSKVNSHYQRPNECPADGKKMSSAHSKEGEVVCNEKATEGDSAEAEEGISEKRDKGRVKEALRESVICLEHCNTAQRIGLLVFLEKNHNNGFLLVEGITVSKYLLTELVSGLTNKFVSIIRISITSRLNSNE